MEMHTDDKNKSVTGLTFRMAMKFKEQVENYLYGFDEKEVAEK